MKLVWQTMGISIELKENIVTNIIVESPSMMSKLVKDTMFQCDGQEGKWLLFINNELEKLHKYCDIIMNPFSIDFNNKKIISRLYQQLKEIGDDFIEQQTVINSSVIQFLEMLLERIPYSNLTYKIDFDLEQLFKLYGVKIENETETVLDGLIEYIKILSQMMFVPILFLVNIRSYLSKEEVLELYKMARYHKVHLVLLESIEREIIDFEQLFIIDKDLCLIVK